MARWHRRLFVCLSLLAVAWGGEACGWSRDCWDTTVCRSLSVSEQCTGPDRCPVTEQSHPGYPTSPCTASYVAVGRDCTVQFPVADLLTKDPGLTLVRASLSAGAHLGEVGGGPTTYDGTGTSCSIGFDGQAPTCTAVATPGEYGFTLECPVRAGVRTVELYCHAPGPALSVDVELTETVCDTPQQMCAL